MQAFPKKANTAVLSSRRFGRYAVPGKTFKTDCWPGLENTRTYTRGYVKHWNVAEGYGILVDDADKELSERAQCQYYVHWSDISGINIKHLDAGAPVAFEVVEEDRLNIHHQRIPRSHMYQESRPMFMTRKTRDSNKVRAINVHQLNRVNWDTDFIELDEKGNAMDASDASLSSDVLDPDEEIEIVSSDVLQSVRYRHDVRQRDIRNGHGTVDKIKRKHGADVAVHRTWKELEDDAELKQQYEAEKQHTLREYPYGYEESDILEQDLKEYPEWFPSKQGYDGIEKKDL